MIPLPTHINHVVDAPMLDAYEALKPQHMVAPTLSLPRIKYYAYLEDKDTNVRTAYVESFVTKIDDEKPDSIDVEEMNDNYCVHFKFLACNQIDAISGQPGNGLDVFEDRARLNLYIFNENHEECWWSKSPAYRVKKTQITHIQ